LQHATWFKMFHLSISVLTGVRLAIEARHYKRNGRAQLPGCQAAVTFAAGAVLCLNSLLKCATQWCQVPACVAAVLCRALQVPVALLAAGWRIIRIVRVRRCLRGAAV
jgi:hypothetical protein